MTLSHPSLYSSYSLAVLSRAPRSSISSAMAGVVVGEGGQRVVGSFAITARASRSIAPSSSPSSILLFSACGTCAVREKMSCLSSPTLSLDGVP